MLPGRSVKIWFSSKTKCPVQTISEQLSESNSHMTSVHMSAGTISFRPKPWWFPLTYGSSPITCRDLKKSHIPSPVLYCLSLPVFVVEAAAVNTDKRRFRCALFPCLLWLPQMYSSVKVCLLCSDMQTCPGDVLTKAPTILLILEKENTSPYHP
jgi:hypothetical protein